MKTAVKDKSLSLKKYGIAYVQGAKGYAVEIDTRATETMIISRTTVNALSRREALQLALKNFVAKGIMTIASASLYASAIKNGSKSVSLRCAKTA